MPETVQQRPKPFWDNTTAQISRKLLLPAGPLQADEWASEPIGPFWGACLRWSSTAEVHDDWLSAIPEVAPQPTEEPGMRAKKFRLYSTAQEKRPSFVIVEKVRISKMELRARAINKEAVETLKTSWLLEIPYDIRNAAMDDLLKAFLSGVKER
ncbi:hypothetical protein V1515DRAFT_629266 [Lipomyces mesembrius]